MTINLKVPDLTELKPRITVFGVGGAGGNAVNNMIASGLRGIEFVVANTDAQALLSSSAVGVLRQWARGDDKLSGRAEQRFLRTGTGYLARVSEWIRDNF